MTCDSSAISSENSFNKFQLAPYPEFYEYLYTFKVQLRKIDVLER